LAKDDADLQQLLGEELANSGRFVLCSSGETDIQIEAVQHEADDAGNTESPLALSALTLGLIPTWYDRELILEVRASSRSGGTQQVTEKDSYTVFRWLPIAPFALFWSSGRAFRDIARKQFGRALETLEGDLSRDGGREGRL
jgi:hypothetical protein